MADGGPLNLNLTPEEKRVYYKLFQTADKTSIGVVTGEVAVSFFEKTGLPAETLGLIWQIADKQNRGLLTPSGFSVVMRMIGHAQAGRVPTEELALQPGPLPRFAGLTDEPPRRPPSATASSPPPGPGPIRVPPLNPDDVNKFVALFEKSEIHNGVISGEIAKQIFERAQLPNEVLGRIWTLVDTKQRGALDSTEFVLAMHLLTAYKHGSMRVVPLTLPPGLYDAAARQGGARASTPSRASPDVPPVPAIPKPFIGPGPHRTQSPLNRPQVSSPLSAQSTGGDWLITPPEKAQFDTIFSGVDKAKVGYINGDEAVDFFTKAQLPEDTLAHIWDLADIDSDGQLSRDEFAVAMYLVRQQRITKEPLPQTIPAALVPPSMRRRVVQPPVPAPATRSASEDLFGLDVFTAPPQAAQTTGSTGPFPTPSPTASRASTSTIFKPFIPSSSFGQSITPQATGTSQTRSPPQPTDDLLGDADPEESKKLGQETTDLANLSNQISSLSKEMQNVQGKRGAAQQELAQNTRQKRDFEARLAQARIVYEQEVKDFKALEERLAISRPETRKLQQELALIDGSRQDLQNQLNQASTALEADQRENAALKEKIREANSQVSQLKAQLEKIRSEARQQKGLVAINKKQLATVEGERDRLQDDFDIATKEVEDLRRTLSEMPTMTSPPMASPSGSSVSQTNPFFRRTTSSSEKAFSPQPAPREVQNDPQSLFDNVFGPSISVPSTSTPPPPTSFRTESLAAGSSSVAPPQPQMANSMKTSDTPSASPPRGIFDSHFNPSEPPPPPQSTQFSSSSLPLEDGRQLSVTSSTKPLPPPGHLGSSESPQTDLSIRSSSDNNAHDSTEVVNKAPIPGDEQQELSWPKEAGRTETTISLDSGLGQLSTGSPDKEAGAFPTETIGETPKESIPKGDVSFDEVFGGPARERSQSQKELDFEEAFAAMKANSERDKSDSPKANGGAHAGAESSEFPPIQELDDDDDTTDSDTPIGFDDDFTPVSPPRKQSSPPRHVTNDLEASAFPPLEPVSGGPALQLVGPGEQMSSPEDDQGHLGDTPGFNGLASAEPPQSAQAPTPTVSYGATGSQKPVSTDFEAAFAGHDLVAAKEVDDDDDDDDDFESPFNKDSSNFDISFRSPSAASKSSIIANAASTSSGNNTMNADFFNFGDNIQPTSSEGHSLTGLNSSSAPAKSSKATNDWDAMFSALDAPLLDLSKAGDNGNSVGDDPAAASHVASAEPTKAGTTLTSPGSSVRQPGWALTADAGEDDLILQSLTSMGYSRDKSLAALEKFDYNIAKAADFLASKS